MDVLIQNIYLYYKVNNILMYFLTQSPFNVNIVYKLKKDFNYVDFIAIIDIYC